VVVHVDDVLIDNIDSSTTDEHVVSLAVVGYPETEWVSHSVAGLGLILYNLSAMQLTLAHLEVEDSFFSIVCLKMYCPSCAPIILIKS